MKVTQMLLTPNSYSRPQMKLKKVTHLVIHWVGNANSTATANRNYFESLKNKKIYASAHYIIGLQGEIIQCIPETEIAYHAKEANGYSIGIENCHPDWQGRFNPKTYTSLVELCAMLCMKYHLEPEQALLRHYDVTKKICPKYYVEHPEAWQQFIKDVKVAISIKNLDCELFIAINAMISSGIKLDSSVWGNMQTMNMKYAKTMIERIGQKFGQTSYKSTIDYLVTKGCISSRGIWDQENFKPEWCKALMIKVYQNLLQ